MKRFKATVKFKSGASASMIFFGENAKARAEEYADHLPGQNDAIAEVRVDPVAPDEANKLAEATSPDFKDSHTHQISNLDSTGNGKTEMAGTPPHMHEVKNGIVIPEVGGEGATQYISHHPGEVRGGVQDPPAPMGDAPPAPAPPAPGGAPAGGDLQKLRQLQEFKEKVMKFGELKNVQIFASGLHRGKVFVEAHIDKIIENFEKFGAKIKPPMVLGHDEKQPILQNSGLPSLGTVVPGSVRKLNEGGITKLIADFVNVPELARKAIELKRYSRISSELYTDFEHEGTKHGLALRRVALLGADIPEVKTLADVVNLGEEGGDFLLSEGNEIEDEGDEDMTKKEFDKIIKKMQEQLDAQKAENTSMKTQLASTASKAHTAAIAAFCEKQVAAGKFLPAWKELGVENFMSRLDGTAVTKYAEGDEAKEVSALAFFQAFIEQLPPMVEFNELAQVDPVRLAELKEEARGGSGGGDGDHGIALDKKVQEYMALQLKAGNVVQYGEAFDEMVRQHPELAKIS